MVAVTKKSETKKNAEKHDAPKKKQVVPRGEKMTSSDKKTASKDQSSPKIKKSLHKKTSKHVLRPLDVSSSDVDKIPITSNSAKNRIVSRVTSFTFISQTARISGLAFVISGALLAVLNLNYALPSTTQLAQVVYPDASVNQKPDVSFSIDGSDILSGIKSVNLTVLGAQSVVVYAYNMQSSDFKLIGSAKRVSDLVWNIDWITTDFFDGTYTIRAVIANTYGSYTVIDSHTYSILNQPAPSPQPAPSDPIVASSSDPDPKAPVVHLSNFLILDVAPLHGIARLQVKSENVKSVKFATKNTDSTSGVFIGYATLTDRNTWTFYWNTKLHNDGFYKVTARIIYENGDIEEKLVETQIFNEAKSPADIQEPKTADEPSNVTASTSENNEATADITSLLERIKLNVYYENPLHDSVSVLVTVPDAEYVELFAIQENSLNRKYLGTAKNMFGSEWKFEWDTTLNPNATYNLFAHIRHPFGDVESKTVTVSVFNNTKYAISEEKVAYVETIKAPELEKRTVVPAHSVVKTSFSTPTDPSVEATGTSSETNSDIDAVISAFNQKLSIEITSYASAIRKGDTTERDTIVARINSLLQATVAEFEMRHSDKESVERLKSKLDNEVKEQEASAVRSESLIKDRIGDVVHNDSDKDEISDYDEVNLYLTDPFVADTDNDGFTDGIEIKTGRNPRNSSSESVIAYTSPKETGVARRDILSIKAITVIEEATPDASNYHVKKALIQGTGLPNSFVTLFIYSTPIIITVKTDEEGSWSYIFDKELDDGTHEIYAGITDNAGRVVAKSDSFGFIKTAEAFSPIDASKETAIVSAPQEPTLFSWKALLVIASVAIVAIGLVLILLGIYVGPRQKTVIESND